MSHEVPRPHWPSDALAILCGIICLFGGVGASMLWAIFTGAYDPVRDDGASPEQVPAIIGRCVVSIVVSVPAAGYLCRTLR